MMNPLRSLRSLTDRLFHSSAAKMQRRPNRPLSVEWLEPRQMLSTSVQIIDDGGAGYSSVGSWLYSSGQGYGGDVRYSALGSGNDVARWTFNVTPGQYRVSASWFAHSNRASDAPYTILDGSNVLGTVRVNQKQAANDLSDAGTNWEHLGGSYQITGNTLVVALSDAANGYVIADAVRIEPFVIPPVQIIDDGGAGYSSVGSWLYSSGQGHGGDVCYSAKGSGSDVARWTFSITPGRYRVSASWFAHSNRASDAPYTILDGSSVLGTVRVNQRLAANDFSDAFTNWEDLGGPYDITGNTLVVQLSDAANGYVIADAVRIAAQDTTPPTISSVSSTSITSTGVTITWTTNEASDTQMEYGTTTSYGSTTTLNSAMTTSHSQALTELLASTLYHYRVKSKDASGNLATSGDLTFTTSAAAAGNTYYVSPSGNDANPGTLSQPWRTIQKAANTLTPGSTVLIRAGTYSERVTISTSGTAGNYITYKNYPGERPLISGTGVTVPAYGALVDVNGTDYIRIEGLEIANSAGVGLGFYNNAIRAEIVNNIIHNNGGGVAGSEAGLFLGYNTQPAYTIIRGNEVYGSYRGGISLFSDTGGYYLIENNTVHDNVGTNNWDPIGVVDAPYVVVRGNTVYNNGQDYIDIGGNSASATTHHILAENNNLYWNSGVNQYSGMKLNHQGTRVIYRKNTIHKVSVGIQLYEQPLDAVFYHNTIVESAGNGLMLWNAENTAAYGDVEFKNNIFAFASGYLIGFWPNVRDGSGILMDGNVYRFVTGTNFEWNSQTASSYGTTPAEFDRWRTEMSQEPSGGQYSTQSLAQLFTNAAARDFTLVPGSDAIDAGVPLTRTSGSGSGTQVSVLDARYFFDGHGWLAPDSIKIGSNAPVQIVSINDATNQITLASSITWNSNDPVYFGNFNGAAPDAGAYEAL